MEPNKLVARLTPEDRELIKAVQHGLPVVDRPFADIAERLSITEQDVIRRLQRLVGHGVIKRFGVVVRHRELGYKANGMVVWDMPDDRVGELGTCIGKFPFVTLSYRRPRRLPNWPYNLFTMVHGRDRDEVKRQVTAIVESCGLQDIQYSILFSTRRFKQRGANYATTINTEEPAGQIKLTLAEDEG